MEAKRAGKDLFEARINETLNPEYFGHKHLMKFGYAGLNDGVIAGFLKYNEIPVTPENIKKVYDEGQAIIYERKITGHDAWLEENEVNDLCKRICK